MRSVAFLSLALLSAAAVASPTAAVVRTNPFIDLVNVANNNEVTLWNTGFTTDSLAVDPFGTLYSADKSTGVLYNVSVPVPLFAGNTGYAQIGDLDYGNGGLWGFSNASQTLFFYDLTSNAVTFSQNLASFAGSTVTGLAYRSDGSIFLAANTGLNQDALYVVGPSHTSASSIGALSISDANSYLADIDFAPDGRLIAMSWYHRDFYSVNVNTAATSLVSSGPHRDVTGMALSTNVVPAPASVIAWGIGAFGLLRRRWA